jgi:hypothetical protein
MENGPGLKIAALQEMTTEKQIPVTGFPEKRVRKGRKRRKPGRKERGDPIRVSQP